MRTIFGGFRPKPSNQSAWSVRLWALTFFASFSLLCSFLYGIIPSSLATISESAVRDQLIQGGEHLRNAQKNTTMKQRSESLKQAHASFQTASKLFEEYDTLAFSRIPGTPFAALKTVISLGNNLTQVLITLQQKQGDCLIQKKLSCLEWAEVATLLDQMSMLIQEFQGLNPEVFPEKYRTYIDKAHMQIKPWMYLIEYWDNHKNEFSSIFGKNEVRTYLFVLQNEAEARPTGGYIGSMMMMSLYDGKIIGTQFLEPHKIDFASGKYFDAPDYLPFIKRLSISESNFSPDPAISTKILAEIFENSGYPTLDGVFYISSGIISKILPFFPNLKLDGYPINKDSFFDRMQWEVEKHHLPEYGKNYQSKQDLALLFDQIGAEIFACEACIPEMLISFKQAFQEKQWYFQALSQDVSQAFDQLGLGHAFITSDDAIGFFLSSYFNKAHRFVERDIEVETRDISHGKKVHLKINISHNYTQKSEDMIFKHIPEMQSLSISSKNQILDILGKGLFQYYGELILPKNARDIQMHSLGKDAQKILLTRRMESTHQAVSFHDILAPLNFRSIEISFVIPEPTSRMVYINQPDVEQTFSLYHIDTSKQKHQIFSGPLKENFFWGNDESWYD